VSNSFSSSSGGVTLVARTIQSADGVAHAFEGDLNKESEVEELFAKLGKITSVDILASEDIIVSTMHLTGINVITASWNHFRHA